MSIHDIMELSQPDKRKLQIKGNFYNLILGVYNKSTTNIFIDERLSVPLYSGSTYKTHTQQRTYIQNIERILKPQQQKNQKQKQTKTKPKKKTNPIKQ